jgi:hypothetical protein
VEFMPQPKTSAPFDYLSISIEGKMANPGYL